MPLALHCFLEVCPGQPQARVRGVQGNAERFRHLAESGADVHGEASFVSALVPPPARVLDAGCGTGRVAVRLAELGYEVVGCDVDAAMVEASPFALVGSPATIADELVRRREELGFSYIIVGGADIDLFAPVVAQLAGT